MELYLLFALSLHHIPAPGSALKRLQNVRVVSYNMGAVLQWDPPINSSSELEYTAQIKDVDNLRVVCNHTRERRCDFGPLPSCHGNYEFRVRAERGGSAWSKINFLPNRETVLGPPLVAVQVQADSVEVNITDPALEGLPLKSCYSRVSYDVKYWRADHPHDVENKSRVSQLRVKLRLLGPEMSYCVQARVYIEVYRLVGTFSKPTCNTASSPGGEGQLSGSLLVSVVAVAVILPLVLLCVWLGHKGNRLVHPKVNLPPLFKKHLSDGSSSTLMVALQAGASPQEPYDTVSFLHQQLQYWDQAPQQGEDHQGVQSMEADGEKEEAQYCNVLAVSKTPYVNI